MKWKQIGLGWVGLDIYQPEKVEKYLKLYPCTPLLRGKLFYTLLACNQCLTIGEEHTSIDPTCCETLVACNSYAIYFSSIGTLHVLV